MGFDYFYGRGAEPFAFLQVPRVLIEDERFADITTDAKFLYSFMLNRSFLSARSGWLDDAGLEVSLVNTMNRERILKQFIEPLRARYDYILLDCMPSLGMLTVNSLSAADTTLIPVQANYLSAKGLEQLLSTINQVRRQINPQLCIEGILITMVDARTNYAKDISKLIRDTYRDDINVFETEIPRSVRAAETSAEGKSIYAHDPSGKVVEAYEALTQEVLNYDEKRN